MISLLFNRFFLLVKPAYFCAFALIALMFLSVKTHAEARGAEDLKIKGKVISAEDQSPLPGVSILVKNTTRGSNTDLEGNFEIDVPDAQAVLVFSFVGFITQEVPVGNRTTIEVQLVSDVKALGEVVVVGYGTALRKDLTGSVSSISSKQMNPGITPNPLQAIQGKVAGLVITQPSGDPTQSPTVRLRGYTSLAGGSDPLYVVDGMIGVPISSVSPNDIETMDVLKDASAAAIYGSRAANGVILITTKKGKAGEPSINFNNYIGISTISRKFNLLDGPGYVDATRKIKGEDGLGDGLRFPKDANGNYYNNDWVDAVTRNAFTNNHDLSIAGGTPNLTYRGSLSYIMQQGLVKRTGMNRLTSRINLEQKAFENRLNISYNAVYTESDNDYANGIIENAITFLPTLPERDANGDYYEVGGAFSLFNPIAMLNNYVNTENKKLTQGGLNLRYTLFDALTLGVNGQLQRETNVSDFSTNPGVKAYASRNGRASRSHNEINNKLLELTANYIKGFGGSSNLSLLAGYSYQQTDRNGFTAANNGFVTDFVTIDNLGLGSGTLINPSNNYATSYRNETKLISFFGRATLNLADRYNFTATLRRDGSSKFGANNKWGLFPSFGAGWILSNEPFMKGLGDGLNYLKLRFGWGQTGNSEGINPYNSIRLYGPSGTYYDGGVGDFLPGYAITQNANPNLKWEVLQTTNIGLDFEIAGGRFRGTIEFYNKLTKDMLYNYNVPANGVDFFTNSILANVGSMKNTGLELSFGGPVIEGQRFSWTPQLVVSYNKNKVISLSNDQFQTGQVRFNAFGGRGLSDVFASYLTPGRPLGEFNYVPTFVGYDAQGNVLMKGGPGTTEPVTKPEDSDAYIAFSNGDPIGRGNPQPFLTGALSNSFTYGNFDLNFQLRGSFGNKILNNLRNNLMLPGSILETNMLSDVMTLPVNYSTNRLTTAWIENGSYVRLDNWQIGYNIPLQAKKISAARVYVGGNNLLLFTKYKGIDPELQTKGDLQSNTSQTPNSLGLDFSSVYPKTRSFQLGVNLTF